MTLSEKPTLLLIDGHSLAFRAFYALNPDSFKTSDGQHTNAVHGFISMMLNILQAEKPTHLAVAFDLSRSSFRTEVYPEYKGTRGETPPEFIGQTELLQEALAAMNIVTLTRENYEADDIIASLADQHADRGFQVYVVSGDRDTFQLIRENTTILYPVKGVLNLARMDDAAVYEKYGVHAKQYPDLAALVGETSDNLIGVPGVGPKTAAKWLQQYGSLEKILENADEIGGKVGESLREFKANAIRNRELNHLIRDLDLPVSDDDLKLGGVDETTVRAAFAKLQFRSLTERVLKLRGLIGGTSTNTAASDSAPIEVVASAADILDAVASATPSEFPVSSSATEAEALEWLTKQHGTVGLAATQNFSGALTFGLATDSKRLVFTTENPAPELLAWLADESNKKAVFGGKELLKLFKKLNLPLAGADFDALLMAYLDNPVRRDYLIDSLTEEYLGFAIERGDPDLLISDSTADSSLDAWQALQLCEVLHRKISEANMVSTYSEIELPTNDALAQMEHIGVALNRDKLEALYSRLSTEVAEIAKAAYAIIGKEINLASPKQLQTVIFDDLGMTGTKQLKTGFSTNAAALNELFEQTGHPFLEKLLEHREVSKIRQIVEIVLKAISSDGRIHTNYVQTGTSTGRLSSEAPNLQNIPIKSERGREIRDAFVVSDGFETLLTADYSQIEMRIMAHLSEDEGIIEAFNTGEDLHRYVGARIFGVKPEDVTSAMRSKVKAMSYGLVYGLSEYGLAKQLRIPNTEAKQLMADYFSRFGGVRRYLATVVDEAKTEGFTVTSFGRRRPFDDLNSKIFQVRENARRAALNAPIQGTAADIMKLAMNRVHEQLIAQNFKSRMLLQVHDELVFEVAPGELDRLRNLATEIMENVVKLRVPLEVQIGIGQTWDEAGH